MLAILWLIVWVTVGDAFYDDYNWYTSDDGVTGERIFESQSVIGENFTDILRSFADSYIPKREGDDEMTLAKAKSRLRMLKVFTHTGDSKDFESSKGHGLPLHEGAKFCTMGRHTKVDCNHCTCVAGQLYMCTGMICPKPPAKPKSSITCKEGKRRKIDSCNYCYCRNGHEICSTKDCRLRHDHLLLRSQYTCHEGVRRKVDCNRCLCLHGEEYCTKKNCTKKKPTQMKIKLVNQKLRWPKCREGSTRQLDACNTCYCHLGREFCEKKVCNEEEHLQYYHNLRYDGSQCDDGSYRKVDPCNFCLCLNGTEMCTNSPCEENDFDFLRGGPDCDHWDVKYEECNRCECQAKRWVCTQKHCKGDAGQESDSDGEGRLKNNHNYFYLEVCNPGQKRQLDDCNTCFCRRGVWFCQNQNCKERLSKKLKLGMKIPVIKKADIINFFKSHGQTTSSVDNIFEQQETKEHGDNTYPDPDNIPENIVDVIESLFTNIFENNEDIENIKLNDIDFKFLRVFNGETDAGEPAVDDAVDEPAVDEPAEVTKNPHTPHTPPQGGEPPCKTGSKKKIDACNWCRCRRGLWRCENKDCGPDIADLPPNCTKGEKVIVDCIPCKCRRRGWKCYPIMKKRHCKPGGKKGPPSRERKGPAALRMTYRHDDDDDEPKKCKIGERYRVDSCNYCYCNRHRELVCSDNKCNIHEHADENSIYPLSFEENQCKIGSRFRKGECNYCYCNYNRQLVCSKNLCTRKTRIVISDDKRYLRVPPSPKICLPEERFRIDNCNWCYCNATRHRVCERNPCNRTEPDNTWTPSRPKKGCYIGSRFTWGECGYCYCSVWRKVECRIKEDCEISTTTTTTTPIPSKKLSPPKQNTKRRNSLNFECEEGDIQQMDDCNFCRCTFNRKWICSDNDCSSNYDHPGITDEKRYLRLPPSPKTCLPEERFRIDNCNWCYCNATRHRVCERNPCNRTEPDNTWIPSRPKKGCFIGSRFTWGECGYCYCSVWRKVECRIKYNCVISTTTTTTPKPSKTLHPPKQNTKPRNSLNFECEEGEIQRIDDCNFCRCTFSRKWMCTDNDCSSNYDHPDSFDEEELLRFTPAPKICLPNERFRIDNCNWCYCNATRHRVCERNPCNREEPDDRWPPNRPRKGCFVGSQFEWGECGYCYCTVFRTIECRLRYNCTIKATTTTTPKPSKTLHPPKQNTEPRNSLNFECEEGEIQRIDDCNSCRCTFSGKWMCSDNDCSSNYDHHNLKLPKTRLCTDGSRRQTDACNYCVCHSGVEFCTQKPCWRDKLPTSFSEPECLVGDPVPAPDPCNLCICLNSDILCTGIPCIQRQSVSKKRRCVEGHKYKMDDGCNFCLCQGGQEFCTSRACLVPDNSYSPATGCNEGEVTPARDRCNLCVCMNAKIVCTNKNCFRRKLGESLLSYIRTQKIKKHKMTQGTKQRCTPGKKYFPDDFDPNCPNDCICDRHELLCTKRKCFNNWDKQTPFKWPLGRVEKKTRNAKQFLKQENCVEYQKLQSDDPCNSCMCLNGRKVCTIVTCTDDIDGELGSSEALITNNLQGNKGSKGKMEKKNKTFCEPFTFFSPDNNRFCRNCFCLHNGLALCLLNLCKYSKDIPHQNSPEELDEVCTPGETGYPTKCITCTCSEQAKWICTREELALCQERDCDEKDEFHMGFSPYCAGCKCAVKEWFCSIQSETCRDYSNATCPLGSFIHNPKQHCSICLCGGYEEGSHNMCFTEAKCVRQVISQMNQ